MCAPPVKRKENQYPCESLPGRSHQLNLLNLEAVTYTRVLWYIIVDDMVLEHSDSVKSKTRQLREYVSARVFKEDGSRRPGYEAGVRKGGDGRDGRKDGRVEEGLSNNASSAQLLKVIVNT